MAKAEVVTLEEVPEALRGEYEPHEGKYRLKIEGTPTGFVPASKHAEFRETNVQLMKALGADSPATALQRAALLQGIDPAKLERLKAIDPDEYAALKQKAAELEGKAGKKTSEVDELTKLVKDLGTRLDASESARKAAETQAVTRANEQMIRDAVSTRFLKSGGRPEAVDYILGKAKEVFKVEDGQIKADGKFNVKGDPLSMDEWMAQATKDYAFTFGASSGGGAAPVGGAGAPRPGVVRLVNPSAQDLGKLRSIPGKSGLFTKEGQPVEIVEQ